MVFSFNPFNLPAGRCFHYNKDTKDVKDVFLNISLRDDLTNEADWEPAAQLTFSLNLLNLPLAAMFSFNISFQDD